MRWVQTHALTRRLLHLKIFLLSVCIEYLPDIAGIDM